MSYSQQWLVFTIGWLIAGVGLALSYRLAHPWGIIAEIPACAIGGFIAGRHWP